MYVFNFRGNNNRSMHSHAPNICEVNVKVVIENIKEKAITTALSTRNVISFLKKETKTSISFVFFFSLIFNLYYLFIFILTQKICIFFNKL